MIIDWGLRIVQIVTFVGLIIKISLKNEDYIDNIEIKTISPYEFNLLHKQFHFINEFNHTSNEISTNHFLFYPKGVDIHKIEFFSLVFKDKLVGKKFMK